MLVDGRVQKGKRALSDARWRVGREVKAVIQRVTRASVEVDGKIVGQIRHGLVVLLGVAKGDTDADLSYLVDKIPALRIFSDETGKMNSSLAETAGAVLAISQFTLLGDTRKGRRPGFDQAADPVTAQRYFDLFVSGLREKTDLRIETGIFGAHMKVDLLNDGPVTFILDSKPSQHASDRMARP